MMMQKTMQKKAQPMPSTDFKQRLLRLSQQPQYLPQTTPTEFIDLWRYLLPRLGLAGVTVSIALMAVTQGFFGNEFSNLILDTPYLFASTFNPFESFWEYL